MGIYGMISGFSGEFRPPASGEIKMEFVRYEKENALGRVTLARGSHANRLTFGMMGELTEALLRAGEECDVVLLSGEGEDFCGRERERARRRATAAGERDKGTVSCDRENERRPGIFARRDGGGLKRARLRAGSGSYQPCGHRAGF